MSKSKKELLTEFEQLTGVTVPIDKIMSTLNQEAIVDLEGLAVKFSEHDHDYKDGTYRGAKISLNQYIELKWGKRALKIYEQL